METRLDARSFTGWSDWLLAERTARPSFGSIDIESEYWTMLQFYSEIKETGVSLIESYGSTEAEAEETYPVFQAFVRQAKSYYDAAKTLPSRNSSLLYYYSFMNLAKAGVVIREPARAKTRFDHGLTIEDPLPASFEDHTISVSPGSNNIYRRFAKSYLGSVELARTYSVLDLFRYCSDLTGQVDKAGFGPRKLLEGVYCPVARDSDKTFWAILGITEFDRLAKYPKVKAGLLETFEEVHLAKPLSRELFDLGGHAHRKLTFLQSKNIMSYGPSDTLDLRALAKEALSALGPTFQQDYCTQKSSFHIALPLDGGEERSMSEIIAIYLLMYYLSRLVRYQPYVLEGYLAKKEAWLIESLVRYCPLAFLRGTVSWITNEDHFIGFRGAR